MDYNYGISKIIKSKTLTAGKIVLCKLQMSSVYAVLVFNPEGKLVDSICNVCDGKVKTKMYRNLNKEYKIRLKMLMEKVQF